MLPLPLMSLDPRWHPTPPVESAAVIKPFVENRQLFRQRLAAGLKVLQKQPECDASEVAAIGYCFGGCGVLELARAGLALKGVVSLHGELATPLPAQPVTSRPRFLYSTAMPIRELARTKSSTFLTRCVKHAVTGNSPPIAGRSTAYW